MMKGGNSKNNSNSSIEEEEDEDEGVEEQLKNVARSGLGLGNGGEC